MAYLTISNAEYHGGIKVTTTKKTKKTIVYTS